MKIFYAILFVVLVCVPKNTWAKSKKKSIKWKPESSDETSPQPAIIAIQIVDPNENSTSNKNSKRTIDNALGYGFNSFDGGKPRYEVYKYSQHDIPPFRGNPSKLYTSAAIGDDISIQKSLQYTLPTVTQYEQTNNILQPGTTLYSTVNDKGHVSGLSSSLSQPPEHSQGPIPVIVLRIYPDQLKDSTLQANLPENHPFSKTINSINIRSLLSHYIKALQNPQVLNQYSSSQDYGYSSPSVSVNTARPAYYTQDSSYQNSEDYHNSNTQDVQGYQYYQQSVGQDHNSAAPNNRYLPTQSYKTTEPDQDQQYYYQPQPQAYITKPAQDNYPSVIKQYYQANQQDDYSQRPSEQALSLQQYLLGNSGQYQEYYNSDGQQYEKDQSLLTHENYPSDQHTKVVFKTKSGAIKTTQKEPTQTKEVKTINIHVPDNIAKIEVQETERPYYTYDASQAEEQKPGEPLKSYYYLPPNLQNAYLSDAQNYQQMNYDDMIKYYTRRGVLSSQLLQNDGQEQQGHQEYAQESKISKTQSSADSKVKDVISAYEETFPTSTAAPIKKRVKSKKRIYH